MNVPSHSNGCGADVAAYALGALPEEDRRRFEAHLETCELCRTDLAALRPVVDALPAAAEPVEPPGALKKRIMSVVEAEAREQREQREHRARAARPKRAWLSFRGPIPALAAAAVLLLAGVGIGLAVLRGDEPVATYAGDCIRGCDEVAMSVDDGHGTLKVEGMDQPPPGRVYQVWTHRYGEDPKPTDALFTVAKDGSASVDVPADAEAIDQVLVTDEPPGGSVEPSTAPYFAVKMS